MIDANMPLSEREQQILDEMERNLRSGDPRAGREVEPQPRADTDRLKLSAFIFVVGLFLLVGFFLSSLVIVGVLAFAAMVSAIVLGASGLSRFFAPGEEDGRSRAQRAFSSWEEGLRRRYRDR